MLYLDRIREALKDGSVKYAVILGLFILLTAPLSWLYYDIRYYIDWYKVVFRNPLHTIVVRLNPNTPSLILTIPSGLLRVYVEADKVSYPPLPVLLFVATYAAANAVTRYLPLIRLIIKLPLILSYYSITYLIGKNYGSKARMLWLTNVFSFITIYTYHTDLIVALAILLAYISYTKNKLFVTGVMASIAFLFKPFSVIPLLPIVLKTIYCLNTRSLAKLTLGFITTTTIVILPFFLVNPWIFIYKAVLYHSYRYPQEYSLWAIPIYAANYDFTKIPEFIVWLWFPIYLITIVYVAIHMIRKKNFDELNVLKYVVILSLLSLLINKIGNLNYFTWYLPLIIIYITKTELHRDNRFLTIYVSIPTALGVLAGFFTFYAAFVVGEPIYIIEDRSLYSPYIAEKSFDPTTIQAILAEFFRLNALWFFKPLYESSNLSYIIYTLLYNIFLIYMVIKFVCIKHGT
ncbi:MAG: hypothetical protein QXX26_03980 [Desulfurococcaceae archaeon]